MSEISDVADVLNDEEVLPKEDEIAEINNLLSDEPHEETNEDDENHTETDTDVNDETKEQIDYTKEIPMPNGEKVSIGTLKDAWQQQTNNILEITERENSLIETSKNVEMMLEWLDAVPADVKEQVVAFKQQELSKEHNKMLEVIPQWKDRNAYEAGRTDIYNLAKEYDMIDLVSNLTDHRAIKLLHDFSKLKNSIKTAVSTIKKVDKPKSVNRPTTKNNISSDEISAINSLLGR